MSKSIVISGIQPTGELHIGNYLGALRQWLALQGDTQYGCFFFIADLHSMTVDYDPRQKPAQVAGLVRDLLALGINPKKSTIFVQSHIPEHTELAWIFNTLTPVGELERMTQYKDKAEAHRHNVNVGLFVYPVLQAADILLYKGERVPVGEDQVQHVELTRIITRKFNNKFGETFPESQPLLTKVPRVMSLHDPHKKMSKSLGPKSYLGLADPPEVIHEKIRKAVADEDGVKNLIELYKLFDADNRRALEFAYKQSQGTLLNIELKDALATLIGNTFAEFRTRRLQVTDKAIASALTAGEKRAQKIAAATMKEVRAKTGLRA